MNRLCVQLSIAAPDRKIEKLGGTARFLWGHPRGGLRSEEDCRPSLGGAQFTSDLCPQGPGCLRRNVVEGEGT